MLTKKKSEHILVELVALTTIYFENAFKGNNKLRTYYLETFNDY